MINDTQYDVIIIGAGASGLFCAMTAGKRGRKVLVLDHANKAGKKILMSGGGKCNFTNYDIAPSHYLSNNPHFVKSALSRYLNWDFIALVSQYQLSYVEKEYGQLFCQNSAKDILQILLTECEKNQVSIQLNSQIQQIQTTENHGFQLSVLQKNQQKTLYCQSLVIATGGLSIPTMGATGFGYQVAEQFGHRIVPTCASLVPFTFTDKVGEQFKTLAGVSLDVIAFNNKASFTLPILFTHRGLSGPACLQLSNYWQMGEPIFINLLPNIDVASELLSAKKHFPKQLIRTILSEQVCAKIPKPFPKKVLNVLQNLIFQDVSEIELANIKDEKLIKIGKTLNTWQIKPSGTEGYRTAEVTKGGVDTKDISSKTMQSLLCPSLYFIGEVLDVTGWLGGYNFQWAWSSGFVAGEVV